MLQTGVGKALSKLRSPGPVQDGDFQRLSPTFINPWRGDLKGHRKLVPTLLWILRSEDAQSPVLPGTGIILQQLWISSQDLEQEFMGSLPQGASRLREAS